MLAKINKPQIIIDEDEQAIINGVSESQWKDFLDWLKSSPYNYGLDCLEQETPFQKTYLIKTKESDSVDTHAVTNYFAAIDYFADFCEITIDV